MSFVTSNVRRGCREGGSLPPSVARRCAIFDPSQETNRGPASCVFAVEPAPYSDWLLKRIRCGLCSEAEIIGSSVSKFEGYFTPPESSYIGMKLTKRECVIERRGGPSVKTKFWTIRFGVGNLLCEKMKFLRDAI